MDSWSGSWVQSGSPGVKFMSMLCLLRIDTCSLLKFQARLPKTSESWPSPAFSQNCGCGPSVSSLVWTPPSIEELSQVLGSRGRRRAHKSQDRFPEQDFSRGPVYTYIYPGFRGKSCFGVRLKKEKTRGHLAESLKEEGRVEGHLCSSVCSSVSSSYPCLSPVQLARARGIRRTKIISWPSRSRLWKGGSDTGVFYPPRVSLSPSRSVQSYISQAEESLTGRRRASKKNSPEMGLCSRMVDLTPGLLSDPG